MEHQAHTKGGNAQIHQGIGKASQKGHENACQNQGHGNPASKIGQGNDGGPDLDGGIIFRILHSVARLVAGNSNGCGRSIRIHTVRQADHIGFRIIVVRQIAAHTLDADTINTVGAEYPLSGLRPGEPAGRILFGIFLKGAVHIAAGPQAQQNTRQHKDQIGPVKTIIIGIVHNHSPYSSSGSMALWSVSVTAPRNMDQA